jgi:hypothetical protein
MISYWLRFQLLSAATFGSGAGVPGLIDQEVTLDEDGCPYLHGRTLKGLLDEASADILHGLGASAKVDVAPWISAADTLFGYPGSDLPAQGVLHVGHARLPEDLRTVIAEAIADRQWTPAQVTHSLTGVRRQTALEVDGSPDAHTLRSIRVILRETPFEARLDLERKLEPAEKGLLAASVKGLRRAGTARNRGRGLLSARLEGSQNGDMASSWFVNHFKQEVCR